MLLDDLLTLFGELRFVGPFYFLVLEVIAQLREVAQLLLELRLARRELGRKLAVLLLQNGNAGTILVEIATNSVDVIEIRRAGIDRSAAKHVRLHRFSWVTEKHHRSCRGSGEPLDRNPFQVGLE